MKSKIHPNYETCTVTCGCGTSFTTRSTKNEIHVEVCSACHPFYTGRQKFVDTAGRVEKFTRKYGNILKKRKEKGKAEAETPAAPADAAPDAAAAEN